VFFSVAKNKLPGYLLPLMPAAAILIGIALDESKARWELPAAALCLTVIPIVLPVLPEAISSGISHTPLPSFNWTWFIPVTQAFVIYSLVRAGRPNLAFCLLAVTITAGLVSLKLWELPVLDRAYSARPLWREIATRQSEVCVESMHRSWRYGLNYYSGNPLPDCSSAPRRWHIRQLPGQPPTVQP
jgi:4-amino-4-deoxy-L-arabinose transferase-like glycosyltransferase